MRKDTFNNMLVMRIQTHGLIEISINQFNQPIVKNKIL